MGQLTHNQVVQEAMELAGNTGLTSRAQVWLGLILRDLFEKSPTAIHWLGEMNSFPITPATLAAGVQTLNATAAAPGLDDPSVRSIKRVWICTMGSTDFTELKVEHATNMTVPPRAYTGVTGVANGRPNRVIASNTKVSAVSGTGQVVLYFDPIPDKAYAVWVVGEGHESLFATYTNNQMNMYPNDLTVVQGVFAMCLKHQQDERYAAEWQEFRRMAAEDRVRFLQLSGANTKMRLAADKFGSNVARKPWDWMGPV